MFAPRRIFGPRRRTCSPQDCSGREENRATMSTQHRSGVAPAEDAEASNQTVVTDGARSTDSESQSTVLKPSLSSPQVEVQSTVIHASAQNLKAAAVPPPP